MHRFVMVLLASSAFAQDDLERVFHFVNVPAGPPILQIGTIVRSMTDITDLNIDPDRRTVTFRGNAEQGKLADWLMIGFDQRAALQPGTRVYDAPPDAARIENSFKVLYLQNTPANQPLQELATLVRSLGNLRRLFTYNSQPAIVLGGTTNQTAIAEWLITHLDKPLKTEAEYRVTDTDVIKLFPVPDAETPQKLQALAVQVCTATKMPRLFTYHYLRALAVRGTDAQLAQARTLIYRGRL